MYAKIINSIKILLLIVFYINFNDFYVKFSKKNK